MCIYIFGFFMQFDIWLYTQLLDIWHYSFIMHLKNLSRLMHPDRIDIPEGHILTIQMCITFRDYGI
jgi:hypothetical protein